ncbi:esterase/lipase family protein [Alloalcanivorax xenomutans]|uniref:esterase/lipase family protein n=1 Tax=Alloalcanivorax xenomutans TaxID=1094342 RepID=UPI0024E2429F|nr:alpha/beta hydrolase [Alloalcanivorax xenomutans]
MQAVSSEIKAPSLFLFWAEWRAAVEFGSLALSLPWLGTLPKGDGHPVLVLPGLSADDSSTVALRMFLRNRGYQAYGWNLGRNVGYRSGMRERQIERLKEIHERHDGQKVSLIGWSLGGLYARELAKQAPDLVRQVITLGSPFKGNPRASNAWRLYESLAGHSVDKVRESLHVEVPPDVPFSSVYSRTDGIVAWECSIEEEGERRENIEIRGSHCGLGHNPLAYYVIADRLAQNEGGWRPFKGGEANRDWFPEPARYADIAS